MARARRRKSKWTPERATAGELDRHGRARVDVGARPAFVTGALPGESIEFLRNQREGASDAARVVELFERSPLRVEPPCPHYGLCAGCSLMHMEPDAQLQFKQQLLLDDFERHGLRPERVLEPLVGPRLRYRRRARLGVKLVPAKHKVLVGFREHDRRFIADLSTCAVLAGPAAGPLADTPGSLLAALSELIGSLSIAARTPQVEVSVGDEQLALVMRVLDPPSDEDRERLQAFAERWQLRVFLQPGGLDSVTPLDDDGAPLRYGLPEFDVELEFRPTDFVQVNADINRRMVALAVELLELRDHHRVLDLFCGLGNFSLALARRAGSVLGLEGDAGLVERARSNATRNGLSNVEFELRDLYREPDPASWARGPFDRVLLDPPRSGAAGIVENFASIAAPRVVYVACSPETLARDASTLVTRHGYRLRAAGIMDMFPHTAHVESIALLTRD